MSAGTAWANPWTLEEGHGQAIVTTAAYFSDFGYKGGGGRTSSDFYRKVGVEPFVEYGLADAYTLGAKASIQTVTVQRTGGGTGQSDGVSDLELWARSRLWRDDRQVWSFQFWTGLPTGDSHLASASLGHDRLSMEPRILYGQSIPSADNALGTPLLLTAEAAYRTQTTSLSDEIRLDFGSGIGLTDDVSIYLQNFSIIGLHNNGVGGFTYDLHKIQPSIVFTAFPKTTLQLGANYEYAGRNTGAGESVFISIWYNF
ncbi:hypothetical protein CWS72_11245 [Telmatospirillum siberiense]|uniref:Uncharacterized protein n=1 Tax=Telmatospirillum siberiense TaxID=382514 RepID=A0A2N3PVK1_9PROT|nr:hypothetical protein CWS72_11245 [Telmatospirillum siberiense]